MWPALVIGAMLALTSASALAQGGAAPAPIAPAHDGHRLRPGMTVTDQAGARVGVIAALSHTRDGAPAVVLDVNGARFRVRASRFKVSASGDQAITTLTASDIRTSEILNGG
jgi:hypothetical protein